MPDYEKEEELIKNEKNISVDDGAETLLDYFEMRQAQYNEQDPVLVPGKNIPEHINTFQTLAEADSDNGTPAHNPLRSIVGHILEKILFTLQLRLFARIGGLEEFYIQLRDLAQSREPLSARLLKLGRLLQQQADTVPECYQALLRYACELTSLSINLYQMATINRSDIISTLCTWTDKVNNLLTMEVVRANVPAVELDRLRMFAEQVRKTVHILHLFRFLPQNVSFNEWLQIIANHDVLPEPVRQWLQEYSDLSERLLQMGGELEEISERYPLPDKEDWVGHINWLRRVLNDTTTAPLLKTYISPDFIQTINLGATLMTFASRFPAGNGIGEQINWVTQEVSSPSPELRQLLAQPPFDQIIDDLRKQFSDSVAHPALLNALLTLADPSQPLWRKAFDITSQYITGMNLTQAISYALRSGIRAIPGGGMLLNGWEWYQSQPPGLSWQETVGRFTADLQEVIYANPQYLRDLLPENVLRSVEAMSFLVDMPVGKSWQEILRWASKQMQLEKEYHWFYQRYVELSLARGVYEALNLEDSRQSEASLRQLTADLKVYLDLPPNSELCDVLDLLPYLPLLASVRTELAAMPGSDNGLGRITNLLVILENHPHPALVELRVAMETRAANFISDGLVAVLDAMHDRLPPMRFPEASAAAIPASDKTWLPVPEGGDVPTVSDDLLQEGANTRLVDPDGINDEVSSDTPNLHLEGAGITAMWAGIIYFWYKSLGNEKKVPDEEGQRSTPEDLDQLKQLLPISVAGAEGSLLSRILLPVLITAAGVGLTSWWVYNNFIASPEQTSPERIPESLDEIEITPAMVIALSGEIAEADISENDIIDIDQIEIDKIVNLYSNTLSHTEPDAQKEGAADTVLNENSHVRARREAGSDMQQDSRLSVEVQDYFNNNWKKTSGYLVAAGTAVTYNERKKLYKWGDYSALKLDHNYWQVIEEYTPPNQGQKIILKNGKNNEKIPLRLNNSVWELDLQDSEVKELNQFLDNLLVWEGYPATFKEHINKLVRSIVLSGFRRFDRLTFEDLKTLLIKSTEVALLKTNEKNIDFSIYLIKFIFELKTYIKEDKFITNEIFQDFGYNSNLDMITMSSRIDGINEDLYNDAFTYSLYGESAIQDSELKFEALLENNNSLQSEYRSIIKKNQDVVDEKKRTGFISLDEGRAKYHKYNNAMLKKEPEFIKLNKYKKMLSALEKEEKELKSNHKKHQKSIEDIYSLREDYMDGIKNAINNINGIFPEMIHYTGVKRNIKNASMQYFDYIRQDLDIRKRAFNEEGDVSQASFSINNASKKALLDVINQQQLADQLAKIIPSNLKEIIWYGDYRDIISVRKYAYEILNGKYSYLKLDENSDMEMMGEQCQLIMASMLYYLKSKNAVVSKLDYVPIYEMLTSFIELSKKLNVFDIDNNKKPPGYYTLSDLKKRSEFHSQYDYNEQFNIYKEKYLDYDARRYADNLLLSQAVTVTSLLSSYKKYFCYVITDYKDANTLIKDEHSEKHNGYFVIIQLVDNSWILIADMDGNITSKSYSENDFSKDQILQDLIRPEKNMGAYTLYHYAHRTMDIRLSSDMYYPYFKKNKSNKEFPPEKLLYFSSFWKELFGNDTYIPCLSYSKTKIADGKNVYDLTINLMSKSLQFINNTKKTSLDSSGWLHNTVKMLIPFYDVIYRAITDRSYSPSLEDVTGIVVDTVAVLQLLVTVGIKFVQLTEKTVERITVQMASYKAIGYSWKQSVRFIISDLPVFLGSEILPSMIKKLLTSSFDLIDPMPIPASDAIKNIYKGSRNVISHNPARFVHQETFKINAAHKASEGGRPEILNKNYAIKNEPLNISQMTLHTEKGKFHQVYEYQSETKKKYYINQDDLNYEVRWDTISDTWRIVDPKHKESFTHSVPVTLKNNYWVPHSNLPGPSGRLDSDKLFSVSKKNFHIENSGGTKDVIESAKKPSIVKSFDSKKGTYTTDTRFDVIPVGMKMETHEFNVSESKVIQSLKKVRDDGVSLLKLMEDYKENDRLEFITKVKFMVSLTENAISEIESTRENAEKITSYFALINKNNTIQDGVHQIYGLTALEYNMTDSLRAKYTIEHPYSIVNHSDDLRDFILSGNLLSEDEFNLYRIKSIPSHLSYEALKQSLSFLDRKKFTVTSFQTGRDTPVTNSLETVFQSKISHKSPKVSEGHSSTLEFSGHVTDRLGHSSDINLTNYLEELKKNPTIKNKIDNPKGVCESLMSPVGIFMKEHAFENIRYRGIFVWSNMSEIIPTNHFVVVGRKNGKDYVFDISAQQFGTTGWVGFDKPLILPEDEWMNVYRTAKPRSVIYASDFNDPNTAANKYNALPRELADELVDDKIFINDPEWFRKYRNGKVNNPSPGKTTSSKTAKGKNKGL